MPISRAQNYHNFKAMVVFYSIYGLGNDCYTYISNKNFIRGLDRLDRLQNVELQIRVNDTMYFYFISVLSGFTQISFVWYTFAKVYKTRIYSTHAFYSNGRYVVLARNVLDCHVMVINLGKFKLPIPAKYHDNIIFPVKTGMSNVKQTNSANFRVIQQITVTQAQINHCLDNIACNDCESLYFLLVRGGRENLFLLPEQSQ